MECYVNYLNEQGDFASGTAQLVIVKGKSPAVSSLSARKAAWYLTAKPDKLQSEEATLCGLLR